MDSLISCSLPSVVKKTCMTTKRKGKRREPSSLPHIRGARLPSAGSPVPHSSGFILTERSVRLHTCARTYVRVREGHTRAYSSLVLKGACMEGGYVRAHTCEKARLRARVASMRARAWNRYMLPVSFLFFLFDSGSSFRLFSQVRPFPCRKGDARESAIGR